MRAEIRRKSRNQICYLGKMREQVIWNPLPGEVPEHGPQFVVFMETNPVIDGIQFVRLVLKENVTALSVRVVAEQVEEHDGLEELFVVLGEIEVVIFGVVLDELLERTRAVRAIFTERGERDKVKTETLADDIRGDLAQCERVLFKVP